MITYRTSILCWLVCMLTVVYTDVDRTGEEFTGSFTVVNQGRNYAGEMHIIEETDMAHCFYMCTVHLQCRSVNYNHDSKDCVLCSTDFNEYESLGPEGAWVNYGTPPKVNGGFCEWNNCTKCSKTCGDGTLKACRSCTCPAPQYGGKRCGGENERRLPCNIAPCPAPKNVALKKPASQSSTYEKYAAGRANDGDYTTAAMTLGYGYSWWSVDLQEVVTVHKVLLFAPLGDFYQPHYYGISVYTRKVDGQRWTLCKLVGRPPRVSPNVITCDQVTQARFVKITNENYLFLYEVEIE